MKYLLNTLIFVAFIRLSTADYCQENFTVAELPAGILKEFLSIVTVGILDFDGCKENEVDVPASDVRLLYYSRNNPTVPILLDQTNPTEIDPNKKLIILAPGWLCNVTNSRMPELTEAYLGRYDANVIGVDWTARSIAMYSESFCSVPGVAKIIGKFLCHVSDTFNIDLSQVHMLGHSLGGQIAGYTGQEVHKQCNKELGRITGLDPAGPLYQLKPKDEKLDASDAILVDVIHTNMAILGFWNKCGDVDFYPNCGTFQPGCLKIDKDTSIADILNLPLSIVACNHLRSADYMIESINSGNFVSRSCRTCPGLPLLGPCIPDILWSSQTVMGEDCPANPKDDEYVLKTNRRPPFAKG